MRRGTVAFPLLLLLSTLPVVPATSHGLAVDAGFSALVLAGDAAAVSGKAFNGTAPYAYAWTHGGSGARFASASSASTTFDTTGLALGAQTLTLTVTDALGDVASDTVVLAIGGSPVLVDQDVVITAGVPDGLILVAPADRKTVNFAVPAGLTRLEATLSWPEADYDLDLVVAGPGGATSGDQGVTGANPERATVHSPPMGTWQAQIDPFLSGSTTARLTIQGFSGVAFPVPDPIWPRPWGEDDAQQVLGRAKSGTAPYVITWDLDGDARFETSGDWATLSRPAGQHLIPFKATDAAGYEVRGEAPLDVRAADHAQYYACDDPNADLNAMEFAQSNGTCWVHGGHHTYALPGTATLRGVLGIAFSVEQQFAPGVVDPNDPATWPVHMETSMDGITWTQVMTAPYLVTADRQYVWFDDEGFDQEFRFLRFHNPLSLTQGLSGFLDHTGGYVMVDDLDASPPPATLAQRTRAYACEADIMEDFFATHPCWFGGVDRYDSASSWHTYVLGDGATVDRVSGTFTLLPWRTDDWFFGNTLGNATATSAFLLTSVDGVAWTERARIPATYGVPQAFSVTLAGDAARFVRLFPEPHANFDDVAGDPPAHHARGYFTHSAIEVEGMLPT